VEGVVVVLVDSHQNLTQLPHRIISAAASPPSHARHSCAGILTAQAGLQLLPAVGLLLIGAPFVFHAANPTFKSAKQPKRKHETALCCRS